MPSRTIRARISIPPSRWGFGRADAFAAGDIIPYWIAQVAGALLAGAVLFAIASGAAGFDASAGFASNGYGEHSPQGYSLLSALVCETVMTFMFVVIVLNVTSPKAPPGFGPLAIGLALTLIHLISIPVTNTSVNPARSTGVAVFQGSWALSQLWAFWVAPLAGGLLAGFANRWFAEE